MTPHEEYERFFIEETLNFNLDRRLNSLKARVKEVMKPTDKEIYARFQTLKKRLEDT